MEIPLKICYAVLKKKKMHLHNNCISSLLQYIGGISMALWFIFLITNFIIPVFIVIRGRRLSSKSPKTISGQIWKLTGYMLLPATLIISFFVPFPPHCHADYSHLLCSADADHYLNFSEHICKKAVGKEIVPCQVSYSSIIQCTGSIKHTCMFLRANICMS